MRQKSGIRQRKRELGSEGETKAKVNSIEKEKERHLSHVAAEDDIFASAVK